jgi:hypothetical protein
MNAAVTLKATFILLQNPAIGTVVTFLSNHTRQTFTLTRVWVAPKPKWILCVTSTSCKNKNNSLLLQKSKSQNECSITSGSQPVFFKLLSQCAIGLWWEERLYRNASKVKSAIFNITLLSRIIVFNT